MTQSVLPQIKTIVFLMLENRSVDSLLSGLYEHRVPLAVYPADSPRYFDGTADKLISLPRYDNTGQVERHVVDWVPDTVLPEKDRDRVPFFDPYEEMKVHGSWNGVMNQLFGDQNLIGGMPGAGTSARCLGFLQDYFDDWYMPWRGRDVLWCYTPKQLPGLTYAAHMGATSDRWFCSVPTQTNPNRAFSLCGTSLGRENNANIFADEQFDVTTIINALHGAGKSWGLYFHENWKDHKSYTEYTFPHITKARPGNYDIGLMERFFTRAQQGKLPNFTYLEPSWSYGKGNIYKQGNDFHPPARVGPADQFVNAVHLALRRSPQWRETLFIITFDEHGGTYDHVAPPWGATNPDGRVGAHGFRFDLFGVRVPTIMLSPFLRPMTVFRAPNGGPPFDHTSFIKTLLLWAGKEPTGFGERVRNAPSFAPMFQKNAVDEAEFAAVAGMADPPPPTPREKLPPADPNAPPPPEPVNALFEGVEACAARAIITRNDSLAAMIKEIADYKRDPKGFEDSLESEFS